MDTFDLLIAAVLAIPVLAVISLIVAMGARKRLKQLELRIAGLEWKLAALADQAPPAAPVTAIIPEPAEEEKTFATEAEPPPPAEPEEAAAPSGPAPASAATDQPRRALRHAMGGLGRRHRARARRLFPGPLFDRARLVRTRRSRRARRHRRARSDRRRRMGAAPRDLDRRHGAVQGRHPERAHRRRHGGRLCRRLRGLRAVRLHRSGRRLRAARHRRARHARRRRSCMDRRWPVSAWSAPSSRR